MIKLYVWVDFLMQEIDNQEKKKWRTGGGTTEDL